MRKASGRTRRQFLGGGVLLAGGGLLSACGGGESGSLSTPSGSSEPTQVMGPDGSSEGTGTQQNALERLQAAGEVRIGIGEALPYAGIEGGQGVGLMPSLHTEIYSRLQVPTLTYVVLPWDTLIPAVQAGEIDMAGAGMLVTGDRCVTAQPGGAELVAQSTLVVPAGNPGGYTDLDSVLADDGLPTVVTGTLDEMVMHDLGVQPLPATGFDEILRLVATGEADAGVGDSLSLRWLADGNDDVELGAVFSMTPEGSPATQGSASFFHPDDVELVEAFNTHLAEIKADGTMLALGAEWGLTEAEVPPADLSIEQLCG